MDNNIEELGIEKERRLAEYSGDDRVISSVEYQKELVLLQPADVKFYANIPTLDANIDGFEGGELIVISGPTKNGKTTFAQTLTKNFESQGTKSLWFSFEVTPKQLFTKFVSAKEFYLPKRLFDHRLGWLEEKIIESKIKYDTRAVFIDHLHYLIDMEKLANSSIEIGSIIRKLKQIAIEHNIVVFLLAHTTKTRFDAAPTEGDVRDSSFIPQEADSTLMIWRERRMDKKTRDVVFTGKTFLMISNHRRTGTMGKTIEMTYKDNILIEVSGSYRPTIIENSKVQEDPLGGLL